LVVKVHCT
jgi:hypothetical protein